MAPTRALYWFTSDLRLSDNHSLQNTIAGSDYAAFLYVINPHDLVPENYHHKRIGEKRLQAIFESLSSLELQLNRFGHALIVVMGSPEHIIPKLVMLHNINRVGCAVQFSYDEKLSLARVTGALPEVEFISEIDATLLTPEVLPDERVFSSFTRFRNCVETSLAPDVPKLDLSFLNQPKPLTLHSLDVEKKSAMSLRNQSITSQGQQTLGEENAQIHLQGYFSTQMPLRYKETRNELSFGTFGNQLNSTRFSTLLALGNLSPRQIWYSLKQYEGIYGATESTYWIGFELIWREYFYWLSQRLGSKLFSFSGITGKKPHTTFIAEHFAAWCHGNTQYPLVNAAMNELNQTGYISNRARQIVASCLVNELGVDWRYGAAYFQQQLIDYDTAINWGNWQYIAGVGVDPRGGRHFNIEKQTALYDPNSEYINKWQGAKTLTTPGYDLVGWPILTQ